MGQYSKQELIEKLQTAQNLLDAVYQWANETDESFLPKNEVVRDAMSVADCAIYDALVNIQD
jgi:hypothetical protein